MSSESGGVQNLPAVGVAVPAAGSGSRMGGVRKPFLELAGIPVLLRAIRPFLEHPQVEAVSVALGQEEFENPPAWLTEEDTRIRIVLGGETRGDSVRAAISGLPPGIGIIAVHDGARPLVTLEIIRRCVDEAASGKGAVAGWPAVDTLKEVGAGRRIIATPPRDRIWHAQTPQVFPREMITRAYREAAEAGLKETDDSALVERSGGEVVMVSGSASNLKVTRPGDLALAEFYLKLGSR
jgi:2-C-methyl-D-erythritol 4-phosphate cytidylyltransferase